MPASSDLMRLLALTLISLACLPTAFGQKFYELEPINYSKSEAVDVISDYFADSKKLESWKREGPSGYLNAFLEAFDIPAASQTLVFSKTSLQADRIHPKNPRAIYFNDDIYVGWVPNSDLLEVSVSSPQTGTNFYTIQPTDELPELTRQTHDCLRCHGGSFTRDVPGHLLRSVYPDSAGQPIFKAGTHFTDQTTPFEDRWGGWLVSDAPMKHMGNTLFQETDRGADLGKPFTIGDLPENGYLSPESDLVSLLILGHQTQLHTLMADLTIKTRRALHDQKIMDELLQRDARLSDSTRSRIKHAADKVLKCIFFIEEIDLPEIDMTRSRFAKAFTERGPKDAEGRSLYQLQMDGRMLRHPLSYLIYSDTFDKLPAEALDYLWAEIERILNPSKRREGYERLSRRNKIAIKEILLETHPSAKKRW